MNKIKTRHILFVIGVMGIIDTLVIRLFVQGMDLGTILPAVIGIVLIIFSFKSSWGKYVNKLNPVFFRFVYWMFLLSITVFIIAEGCIILGGVYSPKPENKPEYVLVLGAGIKEDGTPTLTLLNRLEKCIDYACENPEVKIIVSGGQGRNEPEPEGQAMAKYLVARGIDPERIIIEDRSTSTMENFKFSKLLIEEDVKEVAFITNDFHVFRSTILARRNGLVAYGYPASTPGIVLINSYLREFFALFKSLIFDF
ncbi:MAG: YdcF family protein [Clostridiaceae bacterium]|jgi:uncharacterized SAM-binding protein YcdF (DUF218 family)|nr:YdcF family protein [Clostridiaceae bacterium]